mmetsp:Transcript_19035/g.27424  ORF Transcript_19035/g.27424 Transcript_19035/m.27424 type:complete len:80 (+) Transcript_19035:747-986(+)
MYVADMRDWATGNVHVTTVADMEARHSKAEVARAREAWDLVKTSGFDSQVTYGEHLRYMESHTSQCAGSTLTKKRGAST